MTGSNTTAKPNPSTTTKVPRKGLQKEPTPDNCLFVRLPNTYPIRTLQDYAITTSLRAKLGPDGLLLKEVQTIKSGFALCPTTLDALKTLEARKDDIQTFFRDC